MRIKKTAVAVTMFLAITMVVGVNFADAQIYYTPLVHIPGVPSGGVDLSMYLVGLYDFLLSIVGIAAVLMLIIGGMRYITAAGNQASISDAKDIITSTLAGLLLAILSWVIVAEINPDVLYIKKPGGEFVNTPSVNLGSCYTSYDSAGPTCVCVDGYLPIGPFASANDCNNACKNGHCNDKILCSIGAYDTNNDYFNNSAVRGKENAGKCQCIDGEFVKPANSGVLCDVVCSDPTEAGTYNNGNGPAGKYHGISWRLKVGQYKINNVQPIVKGENFSVKVGEPVYFDFSEVRDCKGNLVHFAINFEGGIPPWGVAPDEWCCMKYNPGCSGTWGTCCNNNGKGNIWDLGCIGTVPKCKEDSYMNTPNSKSENYPIYVYDSYSTVSSTKTPPAPEQVWVGMSVKIGGVCKQFERIFRVDVTSS